MADTDPLALWQKMIGDLEKNLYASANQVGPAGILMLITCSMVSAICRQK